MTNKGTKSEYLLEVDDISKGFNINKRRRDRLKQLIAKEKRQEREIKWAVQNISFKLRRGESMGVIGRNGSGKSTLLQLICGTLLPTKGNIIRKGKIGALLELGSGFNPEFTGIENIFLNASLMGLKKNETKEKLDNILGFADIGEYVHQPVKTYSSGMMVRLAFAVMANVDADILIVDEALSVGDAFFTQKCMRYINRFMEYGCLLFVSHDSNAVMNVCSKAILMEGGKNIMSGIPKQVIEKYTQNIQMSAQDATQYKGREEEGGKAITGQEQKGNMQINRTIEQRSPKNDMIRWKDYRTEAINSSIYANNISIVNWKKDDIERETYGGLKAEVTKVNIFNLEENIESTSIMGGEVVCLEVETTIKEDIKRFICGFIIKNDKGLTLLGDNTLNSMTDTNMTETKVGMVVKTSFIFTIPMLPQGEYSITVAAAEGTQENHIIHHWLNDALILKSNCTSIAAGLAGVAMHSIKITQS